MSDAPPTGAPAEQSTPPAIDPQATHVVAEWKYDSPLIACRFDPSGRYVFAAAQDNTVQRWRLGSDERVAFVGHDSWLRAIDFSPDGETLYTAGYDGALMFWNTADDAPTPIKKIAAHDGWVRAVSVSPDGRLLATCGNDRLVRVWDAEKGELQGEFKDHDSHVYSVHFHPEGEFLLSGDLSGNVHQYRLEDRTLTRKLNAEALHTYNGGQGAHYGGVRSFSFSGDRKHLACAGLHKATNPFGAVQEPLVVVFDWETGETAQSHTGKGIDRGIAWRAVYHPSGPLIGFSGGGSGGFVLFWNLDQAEEMFKAKLPDTILDGDLHPDGLRLATAHYDKRLRISRMAKDDEPAA